MLSEIVLCVALILPPTLILTGLHFGPYLRDDLDKEADMFVNTAIDLGMIRYDEFTANIENWGEIWITNHPYASGYITRIDSSGVRHRSSKRLRLKTVNRLRREGRRRGFMQSD